ncbi:MAG TPA: ATP-binding protein [Caulobacteraceae bacterium]|nr:ATP-binding protein [Caulobacteraceae bacterium]
MKRAPSAVRARPGSLVGRLIGLAAAWSLAVLVAAGLALSSSFERAATTRFDDELSDTVDNLIAGTAVAAGQVAAPTFTDPRALRAYSGEYWQIASTDGARLRPLARSRSLWDRALGAPPQGLGALAQAQGRVLFYDEPGPLGQSLRIAAMQVRLPGVAAPVVFMAAEDRSPIDRGVRSFATTTAITLVLLGAGLMTAVFIQVRVGLRPLFALRREVADLRTGQRERLTGSYPSELAPLAGELNALMAHNQEVVERQRTHVGNLAHALKTPLTVMLAEAGRRPDSFSQLVTRQAEMMRQHVDHHLRRARAAARAQGQGERTPVRPALADLARTLERVFQQKGVTIAVDAPRNLHFFGERQDLLEMAGNVMENACKWCRHQVRVRAAPDVGGPRTLALTVEDDGPGLAAEERERVIQRGARLDESSPGSGLGLSIVDELARAYRGALRLGVSELGGLEVEILLPRADT